MNDVSGIVSLGSSVSFDDFYILSTKNWIRICIFVHMKKYTPQKIVQGFAIFFIKIAQKIFIILSTSKCTLQKMLINL